MGGARGCGRAALADELLESRPGGVVAAHAAAVLVDHGREQGGAHRVGKGHGQHVV
ncbi:hypothetical protein [Microbispora hainanensis]|uniref:hypothetical protein n=1 Tax=Microbispora hainanensis TaxID=568844 RepID=UPI0033D6DE1D